MWYSCTAVRFRGSSTFFEHDSRTFPFHRIEDIFSILSTRIWDLSLFIVLGFESYSFIDDFLLGWGIRLSLWVLGHLDVIYYRFISVGV
jgi:hypothetical protein